MGRFKPTIEVPLFIHMFALELIGAVQTNLMIYRTCYLILGYDKSQCALLGNSDNSTIADLEKLVEPTVNIIDTTKSIIDQIVGLSVCTLAGQWSDKYGRKPVFLVAQIGMVLGIFSMAIMSYFPNISPWFFILSSIPTMLTGGFSTFLVTILSIISDVTSENSRGMRMAIMEGTLGIGILCGSLLSSYLYYATNYPSVYAVSGFLGVLGVVYTIFFVSESLENINSNDEDKSIKGVFKSFNFKDLFKVLTKKRPNYNRTIILLLTCILTIFIFGQAGVNKTYYFVKVKFNWNLRQYTLFSSLGSVCFIIGGILGTLVIHKWLKITESVAVLVGLISEMNGNLVRGLATRSRDVYFSTVLKILGGIISPQCRTLVARLVPSDEVAKLFSLILVIETACSIAASPFYTAIYNATINIDPGIYNLVTAGMCGVCIIFAVIIIILEILTPKSYEIFIDEDTPVPNTETENSSTLHT